MGGKHSRNKGAQYEREVAKKFNTHFPDQEVKRNLEQYQVSGLWDLQAFEFDVECKRRAARPAQEKWLEGLERSPSHITRVPLVVTRGDSGASVACLYFNDFIDLLRQREMYK